MENSFNSVSEIVSGKDNWKIKVRILRLWEVPAFLKPDQANSLEMVLIDEKGYKIHASVRKQLLYVFKSKLTEGKVYKLSCFSVAPSVGSYRTTPHQYKINFQMTTRVQVSESAVIPTYGVSLTKISDVCGRTSDGDYLVDVVGFMTAISVEREYIRDGKVTKMVVFELTDDSGKVECALFGQYVDTLNKLMGKSVGGMPVVLVQFAKVKIFRDKASLQNVMNTTRIMLDPPIEEVDQVRKSVAFGSESVSAVPRLGPRASVSLKEDFLCTYPKKTLDQLHGTPEDGTFVVYATIQDLVDGEDWWYPACKCHRSVAPDSGAYYCKACAKHVFHMVPRYRVKLNVSDATSVAVFVVFDGDVQGLLDLPCSSLVSAAKAENGGSYPAEFEKLKDRKLLFKVEKSSGPTIFYDGSFRVRRVCCDSSVIESFDSIGVEYTPSKCLSKNGVVDASVLDPETDEEETTQAEEFVSGLIVTPDSVLDASHEDSSSELPNDAYDLANDGEVLGSFDAVVAGEGRSNPIPVVDGSDLSSGGSGVKRSLDGAFVEVESDDETLAHKYGRLKKA